MNSKRLNDFKNLIIFKEIHRTERSDKLFSYIESADLYISIAKGSKDIEYTNKVWQHNNVFEFSNPTVEDAFNYIARQIMYHEQLMEVIKDYTKKNIDITGVSLVKSSNEQYLQIFKQRVLKGKKTLRKLRPFILEYTKNHTLERKQKMLSSDIGNHYKGWYINI